MITSAEKKKLKETIGAQHIAQIMRYFVDENIKNRDGNYYSSVFVSRVFNGKAESEKIESGIWSFAEKKSMETDRVEGLKNKVMNT